MQRYDYFVAHEFTENKRDDLRRAIKDAFRKSRLKAYYADEEIRHKRAWFADLSEMRGHIIFEPYESLLEVGEYIAFFKMKIDDNSSSDPVFILDVTGGGFASAIVRGVHFNKPNKYQLFGLKFRCERLTPMEYRVFNQIQRGKVWIDYVAIVKSPRNNIGAMIMNRNRKEFRYEAIS